MSSSHIAHYDIGINFTDPQFRGKNGGKQLHPDDFDSVLERARKANVKGFLVTGDSLRGSKEAIALCKEQNRGFACTVGELTAVFVVSKDVQITPGCHPGQAKEITRYRGGIEAYMAELFQLCEANMGEGGCVAAIGECGLDYDRLFRSDKESQLAFPPQLELAKSLNLPLFLHVRNSESHVDFVRILREHGPFPRSGVVHSFTETNVKVVKELPVERMHFESDGPWCEIRPSHASEPHLRAGLHANTSLIDLYRPPLVRPERHDPSKMVQGRNEPIGTAAVAVAVSAIKGIPLEGLSRKVYANSVRLYGERS